MARIAGVNIPTAKRVPIALQYIYGIGPKKAHEICEKVKIPLERRVNELSDAEVLQIRETAPLMPTLYDTVREYSVDSATKDPRFPPVTAAELKTLQGLLAKLAAAQDPRYRD